MNPYLKSLQKIEFVVTYACTGRCKHCSEGDHCSRGASIDPVLAADAVRRLAAIYDIQTVMAFGGEPLLCPDAVCAIMTAARESGIPKRQIITNGYFSHNEAQIRGVAERLAAAGVNDLLLSVDAFHQETIPLETVKRFAAAVQNCEIPIRLQPAWLVSATDDNPYNRQTRAILESFRSMNICENEGNVIFPEGNARRYLAEYFQEVIPENPYKEDPYAVQCLSVSPDGEVLGGNLSQCDIIEIIRKYVP